jgi:adenosylcobinamide-phosphate synthase
VVKGGQPGSRSLAVALGLVIDAVAGEPPARWHPVARFGGAMTGLEARWYRDGASAGAAYAAVGVGAAAGTGLVVGRLIGPTPALVGAVAVSSAGRELVSAARRVGDALQRGDLAAARDHLPALVGRDPRELDEKEIARAVVESLAENLSDAVVASALWGLVGGAPGVLAHRAANTLDAMVGHRNPRYQRFGGPAARLDDVLNWPAARLSAALVALARPRRAGAVLRVVRRDAGGHPSPNAGVVEAAAAAALGIGLGGSNRYGDRTEVRPALGDGPPPGADDIDAACRLVRRVVTLMVGLLGGYGVARQWWWRRTAGVTR